MTPYRIGWIAAVAAAAMVAVQVAGYDWFLIPITDGFAFPLWVLVAIYAALQFWIWRLTQQRLSLSDDEVARWGDKLEQATPTILGLQEQHRPVGEIAGEIEKAYAIPPDVTLRYIIALGAYAAPPAGDPGPVGGAPPDGPSSQEAS